MKKDREEQALLDAEAAVEESLHDQIEGRGEEVRTLWYFIRRSGKRIAVAIIGFGMVIGGLLLIPLPGPGWAIVFAGLAVLATEFVWAERLLGFAKKHASNITNAVIGEKGARSWWAIVSLVAALVGPCIVVIDRLGWPIDFSAQRWWMDRVGLVTAVVAVFCGHVALATMKRSEARRGKWLAIGALVLGYGFIAAVILIEIQ